MESSVYDERATESPGRGKGALIMAKVFSDGAGDFSFVSKLIEGLIEYGFVPQNIHVVVGIPNCDDLLIEPFSNAYNWVTSSAEQPPAKEYAQRLCELYRNLYGLQDGSACTGDRFQPARANHFIDAGVIQEIIEYVDKQSDAPDYGFPVAFKGTVVDKSCFRTGIRNLVKFFLQNPEFREVNFYVRDTAFLERPIDRELRQQFGSPDLVVTFMVNAPNADCVQLQEGGWWSEERRWYAPGFDAEKIAAVVRKEIEVESQFALGINQLPAHWKRAPLGEVLSKIATSAILSEFGGKYHVAYLPLSPKKTTFVQMISYSRFIQAIRHFPEKLVLVNKEAFAFLSKMSAIFERCGSTFGARVTSSGGVVSVGRHVVSYYDPMDRDVFLTFLEIAQPECLMTGDQSFFEALSMRKVVIYDAMPHKYKLQQQVLDMFSLVTGKPIVSRQIFTDAELDVLTEVNRYDAQTVSNKQTAWVEGDRLFIYKDTEGVSGGIIALTERGIQYFSAKKKMGALGHGAWIDGTSFVDGAPPFAANPKLVLSVEHADIAGDCEFMCAVQKEILGDARLSAKLERVYEAFDLKKNLRQIIESSA